MVNVLRPLIEGAARMLRIDVESNIHAGDPQSSILHAKALGKELGEACARDGLHPWEIRALAEGMVSALPRPKIEKTSFPIEEAKTLMESTRDPTVWGLCNTIVSLHQSIKNLETICENAQVERDDLKESMR